MEARPPDSEHIWPRRIFRSRANQLAQDPESEVMIARSGMRGESSQVTRCGLTGLALAIAREVSRAHRGLERQLLEQKLLSSGERLALWILGEHRRAGGAGTLETPLTRSRLAAYLGTSEDNFSRLLRGVKAAGVTLGPRSIVVSDVPALTRMAGPPDLVAAALDAV